LNIGLSNFFVMHKSKLTNRLA